MKVGDLTVLPGIRYVITLDSDTQLPRDAAHKLVGAMAHPLNRAVIDPVTNMVVAGYGILQPRIGISIQSASSSRLASIYSGQTGFDIYTRAISDVYQDLFGEGIFTGKGIYDVDALRAALDQRFPENALLSHDLIEGAYARAGLVSDIELIDDYPSHFSAYSRRKHRWVRGDWQIMRWLLPRVPDFHGNDHPESDLPDLAVEDSGQPAPQPARARDSRPARRRLAVSARRPRLLDLREHRHAADSRLGESSLLACCVCRLDLARTEAVGAGYVVQPL